VKKEKKNKYKDFKPGRLWHEPNAYS